MEINRKGFVAVGLATLVSCEPPSPESAQSEQIPETKYVSQEKIPDNLKVAHAHPERITPLHPTEGGSIFQETYTFGTSSNGNVIENMYWTLCPKIIYNGVDIKSVEAHLKATGDNLPWFKQNLSLIKRKSSFRLPGMSTDLERLTTKNYQTSLREDGTQEITCAFEGQRLILGPYNLTVDIYNQNDEIDSKTYGIEVKGQDEEKIRRIIEKKMAERQKTKKG